MAGLCSKCQFAMYDWGNGYYPTHCLRGYDISNYSRITCIDFLGIKTKLVIQKIEEDI